MADKIKNLDVGTWTILIGMIYLAAWFADGYLGFKFSCSDLISFYTVFVIGRVAKHGIDSMCNSPKGEPPDKI
jgi:hypothetical protein